MSKEKFLSIDSVSQEDITAMFNAVCKQIIGQEIVMIKKNILDFKGEVKNIRHEEPTLHDLIDILNIYDIRFEFSLKACWTDFSVKAPWPPEKKEKLICDEHKELVKAEKESITNPELIEIVNKEVPIIPAIVNETAPPVIDISKIPDFL